MTPAELDEIEARARAASLGSSLNLRIQQAAKDRKVLLAEVRRLQGRIAWALAHTEKASFNATTIISGILANGRHPYTGETKP
jgi:hypothetical protein